MAALLRMVVTGGPGTGKSTLLDALELRGLATEPEVARAILREEGGMALRADDPAGFALAMFDAELSAFRRVEAGSGPVLFDRGFPDIAGFLHLEGLPVPAAIDRACSELRYEGPIFRAPPWDAIYRRDAERIQDWDAALASDAAVSAAWREYGYTLIDLPLADVSQRADFVLSRISGEL